MKKFQKLLIVSLAILLFNIANALEIVDVRADYWAGGEIIRAIQNGYISLIDENQFRPEDSMSRSEFVTALLKVIKRNNEPIVQKTSFKDVNAYTPNEESILLSEQIRMAFGYPDKTFKPNLPINHNETMSMISNITKGDFAASDITTFADYVEIPLWARRAYIKNVAHGFYINHPDSDMFTPTTKLTRAEAAVLFDKISKNLDLVQEKYRDLYDELSRNNGPNFKKAKLLSTGTLNLVSFAPNNKVRIYDNKKVIEAGNILIGTDVTPVKSRKDKVGNEYVFTAPADVYTAEGVFIYPKGTEFYARDEKKGYSAWRSKPERSVTVFYKYSLPTGEVYDMAGVPFTKDDEIIYVNDVKSAKQAKKLTNYKMSKREFLIACAHQKMPNIDYKIKPNKTLYILLTGDMVIPTNNDYINLRTKKSALEDNI